MIKKLFIGWLLFLWSLNIIFALDLQIKLNLDRNEITTNDLVNFSISAKWIDNVDIKNIQWIESFDIFWSSQSSSISIINWNMDSNFTFNYSLKPKKEWKFQLWPIKINKDWKEFESNYVSIDVKKWKDNIFLNPTIPDYKTRQDQELTQNSNVIIQDNLWDDIDIDYWKIIVIGAFILIILSVIIIRYKIWNKSLEFEEKTSPILTKEIYNFEEDVQDNIRKILIFIQEKYNIDTNGKTHWEIVQLVSLQDSIKWVMLKEIFELTNEARYSKKQIPTTVLNELLESFLR